MHLHQNLIVIHHKFNDNYKNHVTFRWINKRYIGILHVALLLCQRSLESI